MRIARFSFTKIGHGPLGDIFRPYADVLFFAKKTGAWLSINMVVDSGADYTLLPRRYAAALGIDLGRECVAETTLGVGGSETVYLYKKLPVRIGNWQKEIPVGFLERDDIPALLGRLDCLEVLKVTFQNYKTTLEK
ncbi:MAG: retroviral-like aspartic protease family protein [Elusimicrobia bacterium]|nr:retroviral-like aspartic protease family protein [Elusimicrobiota bacterium]